MAPAKMNPDLTPEKELEAIGWQLDRWGIKRSSKLDGPYSTLSRMRMLRNQALAVINDQKSQIDRLERILVEEGIEK